MPKLCPAPSFLTFLTRLPEPKINNLQIPGALSENKSPSPHHIHYKAFERNLPRSITLSVSGCCVSICE